MATIKCAVFIGPPCIYLYVAAGPHLATCLERIITKIGVRKKKRNFAQAIFVETDRTSFSSAENRFSHLRCLQRCLKLIEWLYSKIANSSICPIINTISVFKV